MALNVVDSSPAVSRPRSVNTETVLTRVAPA
jgi:hypothetical protein